MKKALAVLLVAMMLFCVGCQRQEKETVVTSKKDIEPSRQANSFIQICSDIENLLYSETEQVMSLNMEKYILLFDPDDYELIKEQTSWFNDLKLEPIQDFKIKHLETLKIDENNYKVKVEQSYNEEGKEHKVIYSKRIVQKDGKLYDAGNYFNEKGNENFVIKYTDINEEFVDELLQSLKPIYEEYTQEWGIKPDRKIVVKMFDDREALRQSIKLSMWACSGWYEFGESIRMYISKEESSVEDIIYTLRHELVHLYTMSKSNGNLAYWLSEGLASVYCEDPIYIDYESMVKDGTAKLLSVDELEDMDLELLEDRQQIADYYNNSYLLLSYIVKEFGEDKMLEILTELSKKQRLLGTGHENDETYKNYLHEVLPEVIGLKDFDEFKANWEKVIRNH